MKIPYSKPFQTYKEQIQLLQSRGMIFDDENKAENILEHINYYRLGGYWLPFEEDHTTHKFKPNTKFENVLALYNFDQRLRLCLLSAIEKIEVSIRSHFAYELAKEYGSHPHLDSNLFEYEKYLNNLDSLKKEVKRSEEVFIEHYLQKYEEKLPPIWATCEVMSFGSLSKWFKSLKSAAIGKRVSQVYKVNQEILESWLSHLRIIRNISAHHSRLWDTNFRTTPKLDKSGSLKNQLIPNSQKIYNSLVILLYLIDIISPNDSFRHELKDLFLKNKQNLLEMGFPNDWANQAIWQAT